ncbi:MAG: hypothetical protein ACF8PN_07725 [Phycisphaerales bacterium]
MLRPIRDFVAGVWGLLLMGFATGFRLRGRYWRWRDETAFGGFKVERGSKWRAALHYGQWVTRMRRMR